MGPPMRFRKYEHMVHPYSGLDPVSWQRILDHLHAFEQLASRRIDSAASSLYAAVEDIRDLALANRRSDDSHIQDQLNAIATNLAMEGEFIINENAIAQGIYFFPKYLNETIPEYVDDDTKGQIKNHGQ
jgi:hypothetical protein